MRHAFIIFCLMLLFVACDQRTPSFPAPDTSATASLSVDEVRMIIARAVDIARQLNDSVLVAVTDREGNILGAYNQRPSRPVGNAGGGVTHENPLFGSIARARTAAFLSSNQAAFTTLTACGITRDHYPPSQLMTAGGPLYGVPYSSIGGSDIQPNNGTSGVIAPGRYQPGLTGAPGGVPLYKDGALVGGLGVAYSRDDLRFDVNSIAAAQCQGAYQSERIARMTAVSLGYEAPRALRADAIYNDGVQLLYSNESLWPTSLANSFNGLVFTLTADSLTNTRYGNFDSRFPLRGSLPPKYPNDGYVSGYEPRDGRLLTAQQVDAMIQSAVARAQATRAEIRLPVGQKARINVAISDVDGKILALYRMGDAPIFGIDVSAQKARTAVAFNDTAQALCQQLRNILISKKSIAPQQALAVTTRTIWFLAQAYYPPGIDGNSPGPLYTERDFKFQGDLGTQPFGNGITIFPGGVPLYVNGVLVGGVGVSGDGVNQDDYIAMAGAAGYEAPSVIRADNFSYLGANLPYVKFPRNP